MTDELHLTCRPFPVDAPDKPLALKPLEEAAEAFGAWQESDERGANGVLSECCDTIQASVNLFVAVCEANHMDPQEALGYHMRQCERRNRERGRYE